MLDVDALPGGPDNIDKMHEELGLEELQVKNEALSKELVEKTTFQLKN